MFAKVKGWKDGTNLEKIWLVTQNKFTVPNPSVATNFRNLKV
jgi:hypothetical protein